MPTPADRPDAASLPLDIAVRSVQALRAEAAAFLFLDCREPDEHALARIPGTLLIPMAEIPERLGELESHRTSRIVVHCHHGGRSLRVTQFLRARGFANAQNMAGGIEAWAVEVDPAVPRY